MYRPAVRALLVADEEILLVRLFVPDSGKHIWLAPGGGIEPEEDHQAALIREVWEETGHKPDPDDIVGPVWHRRYEFVLRGESIDQEEHYYYWPVDKFEPTFDLNADEAEAELLEEYRWWTIDEIVASDEIFVPLVLGAELEKLLVEIPTSIVEVGI